MKRVQGVGTIVTADRQRPVSLGPNRGVAGPRRDRDDVSHEVLSVSAEVASPSVAAQLEIDPRDRVVFIERMTRQYGRAVSLASIWLPFVLAEPILDGAVDLPDIGFFEVIELGLGLEIAGSEHSVEATAADEAVARVLAVPTGTPLLLLGTLIRVTGGRPAALAYSRGRADGVRLEFQTTRPPSNP